MSLEILIGGNSSIGLGIAEEFKQEGSLVGGNIETSESTSAVLRPNFIGINTDISKTTDLENISTQPKTRLRSWIFWLSTQEDL